MAKKIKVRSDVPKEPALIIQDQLILKPGVWKGVPLTSEQIKMALEKNTDWSDSRNSSIYFGHDPKKTENWVGTYDNRRYLTLEDGAEVEGYYGDLKIYDLDLASKLAYGKAKMAVSQGMDFSWGRNGPSDLRFNHVGIVHDPGCRDERLFLNLDSEEEFQEGKTYTGESRVELKLDSENEEELEDVENDKKTEENSNIGIKEGKKMKDENNTSNASIDETALRGIVENILKEKEAQSVKPEDAEVKEVKSDEEGAKSKESKDDADKPKKNDDETKSEKMIEVSESTKPDFSKELGQLQEKINAIYENIGKPKEVSQPKTVAQPDAKKNEKFDGNQEELAKKLVRNLEDKR